MACDVSHRHSDAFRDEILTQVSREVDVLLRRIIFVGLRLLCTAVAREDRVAKRPDYKKWKTEGEFELTGRQMFAVPHFHLRER
jgi:hypothetical protein